MNGINIVSEGRFLPKPPCRSSNASSSMPMPSEIKLTGNDMELGIETKVEGTILERGKNRS
ncbi:MAG: hypothetical protein ACLR8P_04160 [Clostridium fessum]